MVKGLAKTLGKHYEVVLHDISDAHSSIIAIENGHITGREVGAPATDLLFEIINSNRDSNEDMTLNYTSQTKDGKRIKSSTILIRNNQNNIVGALCINFDLTSVNIAKNFLEQISIIDNNQEESSEKFPENVDSFLKIMIENALEIVDKPVSLLTKEEKIKIVKYLSDNNVFDIKRSVKTVAEKLNVSKYTIYNYLEEVKLNDK